MASGRPVTGPLALLAHLTKVPRARARTLQWPRYLPGERLLAEPNAVGWIAFLVLVIALGAGVLYIAPNKACGQTADPNAASHASR